MGMRDLICIAENMVEYRSLWLTSDDEFKICRREHKEGLLDLGFKGGIHGALDAGWVRIGQSPGILYICMMGSRVSVSTVQKLINFIKQETWNKCVVDIDDTDNAFRTLSDEFTKLDRHLINFLRYGIKK